MLVKEMSKQLTAGINNIDIPGVNVLPNGVYTIVMNNNENNQLSSVRFIKQ